MAYRYTIYPEALTKLKDSGLEERFLEAKKKEDFPYVGHVHDDQLKMWMDDMKDEGYFKTIPSNIKAEYDSKIKHFYKNLMEGKDECPWTIKKPTGEEREKSDNDDFVLLSGGVASSVLGPDELWDFEKFGFSSIFDFLGSFGTLIKNGGRLEYDRCHRWGSEFNGQEFISEITGSEHGDFRFNRTDITPYETLDPLGNSVSYRPTLRSDGYNIIGYHSVEPGILVAIIKYVEQEKIKSKILEDRGRMFLEEVKEGEGRLGAFADAGIGGCVREFIRFDIPLIRLDESNRIIGDLPTSERIGVEFNESNYGIYVNSDGNLAFCMERNNKFGEKQKKPSLIFPSGEIDHFIRGLFVQAARGKGRTSLKQIRDVLEYRFSEQFEKDEEFRVKE